MSRGAPWYLCSIVSHARRKLPRALLLCPRAENRCYGNFQPGSKVATLNFLMTNSTVTVTFRVMDADTLAVCIVEVDAKHTPSIQYGNMMRLHEPSYGAEGG